MNRFESKENHAELSQAYRRGEMGGGAGGWGGGREKGKGGGKSYL